MLPRRITCKAHLLTWSAIDMQGSLAMMRPPTNNDITMPRTKRKAPALWRDVSKNFHDGPGSGLLVA